MATTSNFVDGGISTSPASSYATSGVIKDPTDPAKNFGIDFTIGDAETTIGSLTVTATSSSLKVLPISNLNLTGSGASRNLKITPNAEGFSDLTVTVNDGVTTSSFIINYASSNASTNVGRIFDHGRSTLTSVLNQDFQDFEFIVIDDGSDKDPVNNLLNFAIDHEDKITYLQHRNCSQAKSVNKGIKFSSGEYITMIYADDEYKPNHLNMCLKEIKNDDLISTKTHTVVDKEEDYYVPDKFNINTEFKAYQTEREDCWFRHK